MASSSNSLSLGPFGLLGGVGVLVITTAVLLGTFVYFFGNSNNTPITGIPLIGKQEGEKDYTEAKKRWMSSAKEIVNSAVRTRKHPFQVFGMNGPLIIIPPHMTSEVRTDERMTFKSWLKRDFFTTYPGFEGFKPAVDNNVFIDSVRMGLTQSLATVVHSLAEEAKYCYDEAFPPAKDWTPVKFNAIALRFIARLSAQTFMPPELAKNEEWLRISVEYTLHFGHGGYVMRAIPPLLRPIAHWFLPQTKQLREDVETARRIIEPTVIARRKEREADIKAGRKPKKYTDAFAWMDAVTEKTGDICNAVHGQLNYSLGAVHTTSITFTNCMYNIVGSPGSIELLREELIEVLGSAKSWDKTTLNGLKMMDSFMKESNRMHPASFMTMNRIANETITLSDGTIIPKGSALTVPNTRLYDEEFYENPQVFNGRRFYDMRQRAGEESKHQFVTTGDDYLPFGHGKHACPGRFFASNEIKILLAFAIMQYDFKFPEDQGQPPIRAHGLENVTNPEAIMLYKSRTPEVSLDLDHTWR
ncbi:cytochrome P450 [Lophium mytilinum]|uniref:Cytochrome P450 n=1 Tax=Lophium mytilinum TaxID=390894 RepID=A0A6A6QMB1_9PEZI|nr:cytochrome P450 [Lophium mytilinum]